MKPGFAALLGPSASYLRRKKEAFYQNCRCLVSEISNSSPGKKGFN
jgi:hypothetical protein